MVKLGRYTLLRKVATGGMAEVWKAKIEGTAGFEKTVALKKILPHLIEDVEFLDMFIAEAKLVATLEHPNIVQVFDFGSAVSDTASEYFITMEYISGQSLSAVLRKLRTRYQTVMPVELAVFIAREAATALAYAHGSAVSGGSQTPVVHRDVSPHNILIAYSGEVKVTDFGIAKVLGVSQTAPEMVRGKTSYLSPEQARLQSADYRSDIFSLGSVLFELITGAKLFDVATGQETIVAIREFHPFRDARIQALDPPIRGVMRRALEPNPDERFQTAAAFQRHLGRLLDRESALHGRDDLASLMAVIFENEREEEIEGSLADHEVPAGSTTVPHRGNETLSLDDAAPEPLQAKRPPWLYLLIVLLFGGLALLAALGILQFVLPD